MIDYRNTEAFERLEDCIEAAYSDDELDQLLVSQGYEPTILVQRGLSRISEIRRGLLLTKANQKRIQISNLHETAKSKFGSAMADALRGMLLNPGTASAMENLQIQFRDFKGIGEADLNKILADSSFMQEFEKLIDDTSDEG